MATGIPMNCLDIAAVNALVIWCCKVQSSMLVTEEYRLARIGLAVNPTANSVSFNMQPGICVLREYSGEGICLKKTSPSNIRGTRHPGKK